MIYPSISYTKPKFNFLKTDGAFRLSLQFREILFVDETTGKKAFFTYMLNSTLVAEGNYGARLPGLWIAGGGEATPSYEYQLLVCDISFYSGFFLSGFTSQCYKICRKWCDDYVSPFFRTATSSAKYPGIAFNVNGHHALNKTLISVGLR